MKIENRFLARHLEAAAVDQLAADLQLDGYIVERDAFVADGNRGRAQFDLIARRGEETIFYEIKVIGQPRGPQTPRLKLLAEAARRNGGRFHLVVVRPERGTDVAVIGIEEALRNALIKDPTGELGRLGQRISVEDVSGVEVGRIEVRQSGDVDVAGVATMTFSHSLDSEQSEPGRSSFPFAFRVTIGPGGSVLDDPPPEYDIDLTEWYGNEPNDWE